MVFDTPTLLSPISDLDETNFFFLIRLFSVVLFIFKIIVTYLFLQHRFLFEGFHISLPNIKDKSLTPV